MRGRVTLASEDPERDAARYVEALSARLSSLEVGEIRRRALAIDVDVDTLRLSFTWLHPFKGTSSAQFRVVADRDAVRVEYDVGITGMIIAFALFTIVVFIYSLRFPPSTWNLAGPPTFIGLVLALNIAVIHFQVRRTLSEVGRTLASELAGTKAG